MFTINGQIINRDHVESARMGTTGDGKKILTLIHAKEGQKDYSGPEAEAAWEELQKPVPSVPDVHSELAAIRSAVEEGLALIKSAMPEPHK